MHYTVDIAYSKKSNYNYSEQSLERSIFFKWYKYVSNTEVNC